MVYYSIQNYLMLKERLPNPILLALRISKTQWKKIGLAFVCITLATVLRGVLPYIMKQIVDAATVITPGIGADTSVVWWYATVYIAIVLLSYVFIWIKGLVSTRARANMGHSVRTTVHKHIAQHSNAYFSKHFSGNLANKINNADTSVGLFFQLMNMFWPVFLRLIVAIILAFSANISIALLMLSWLFVFIPVNLALLKRIKQLSKKHAQIKSHFTGQVVDFISNITLVKIFSKEKDELQRIRNVSKQRLHTNITLYGYKTQMNLINNILQGIMLAVVLFYSLFLWQNGIITLGDVIMFFGITASIQGAMIGIAESIDLFFDQYGQLEEGLETLLKPHDIIDKKGAQDTPLLHGDIQFNTVSFKYNGVYVFKNLNLHIPQNQKVGIVGHSGAGKTTLLKILLRLYDIQKGEILIDKKNIQDITQNSLRKHMSTVTQEPEMFNRSIYENISYGFNTTKKGVIAAAKIAHAHEFIQQLPKKYDTVVGERGVTLSGGQKQRIAIARAVIKNAPILVLDEATSALDSESETLIQDALNILMKDKTVIAVAHRLSTLLAMDRIIVLEKGKIIEDGNHKTLLKKKGVYASMWKKQSGGYLKE